MSYQIKQLSTLALQNMLNKCLEEDPVNKQIIDNFIPKAICIFFTDLNYTTFLIFRGQRLHFNQDYACHPKADAHLIHLQGKSINITKLFHVKNKIYWKPIENPTISLVDYDNVFQQLSKINFDFEFFLTRYMGKLPAAKLTNLVTNSNVSFSFLQDNIREYLLYELNMLVEKNELIELEEKIGILENRALALQVNYQP